MARHVFTDYLQSHPFWMMDVTFINAGLPVFNPILGFASITAPEITLETQEIAESNWLFNRIVIKRGSIGSFSIQRGVTFADSDFWQWTMEALSGGLHQYTASVRLTYRRDLLLVHFFARNPMGLQDPAAAYNLEVMLKTAEESAVYSIGNVLAARGIVNPLTGNNNSIAETVSTALSPKIVPAIGPFGFALRVPARAYLLRHCIPVRHKAGSDYNAADASVSIAELDFACEAIEEVSLSGILKGALSGVVGGIANTAAALA